MKKIHDALIGIVYADDRAITHTMAVRVDASEPVEVTPDPAFPAAAANLAESLNDPAVKDVLYIEIGTQSDSRVYLGPVQ